MDAIGSFGAAVGLFLGLVVVMLAVAAITQLASIWLRAVRRGRTGARSRRDEGSAQDDPDA